MSFEYTSSYFIVIPTGNKKKNRKCAKWGGNSSPLFYPLPTLPSCVHSACINYIYWIWRSPVISGVIDSYQYPQQDGNKFIILMWPVFVFLKGIVALWCQLHWTLYQENLNVHSWMILLSWRNYYRLRVNWTYIYIYIYTCISLNYY